MSQEKSASILPLLSKALHRIRKSPPRAIASPPTQPRRASVALIIRVVPDCSAPPQPLLSTPPSLTEFFRLDWVNAPGARPEILFLKRDNPLSVETSISSPKHRNTNEAHVAFPGGRSEEGDEGGLYTAMRQTWEEIGLDLAEPDYTCIGQLDDREITTSLGKRLLMILSPFVFLQLTPTPVSTEPILGTTLHWTPLAALVSPYSSPRWSNVSVDAASRLAPKQSSFLRLLVRLLIGQMQFPAIVLEPTQSEPQQLDAQHQPQLKLWGLSLGMTLDLVSHMVTPDSPGDPRVRFTGRPISPVLQLPSGGDALVDIIAPSLASVFPRFSYPDVNFWIWVFGKRYREVIKGWEASVRAGGSNDRRINWSGSALSTHYAAIRKALIVVIVARALGILFGLGFAGWWVFSM